MCGYLKANYKKEHSKDNLRRGCIKIVNIVLRVQYPSQFRRLRRVDFYSRRKHDKKCLITMFGMLRRVRCSRTGEMTSIILNYKQKNFGILYNFILGSQNFLSLGDWNMQDEGVVHHTSRGRKNDSSGLAVPKFFSRYFFERYR